MIRFVFTSKNKKKPFCGKKWLVFCLLLFSLNIARSTETVLFWHSFAGHLGQELTQLVEEFNQNQTLINIRPRYKGDYIETLTSYAAAKQAGKAPGIVQVFEVGTAFMEQAPGLIQPVDDLMRAQGYPSLSTTLLPGIASFYTKKGVLQAMPLNVSLPVMFYNQLILKKLGYDGERFPKTWQDFDILLHKLKREGYKCGYATAYPAWIHVEVYAAMHRLNLSSSESDSYSVFSQPAIAAHWQRLRRWQNDGLFVYGGRNSDATVLFTSGRCPIFSQSSGSLQSLQHMVSFPVAVAALPYDSQWAASHANPLFGGAGLWVLAGQSQEAQRGIAAFLLFLSRPETQVKWYQKTGYLPMISEQYYTSHQVSDLSGLMRLAWEAFKVPGEEAYDLPQNQLRTVLDKAMESVFSRQKTVQLALQDAQKQINYCLHRYKRSHP